MLSAVKDVDFKNITEGLPAFVTILAMPLTYSIGDGLTLGVLSYVAVNLLYNIMAPAEKRKKSFYCHDRFGSALCSQTDLYLIFYQWINENRQ